VMVCAQAIVVTEKAAMTASRRRCEKWCIRSMLAAFRLLSCWGFTS
jgi:hypothetical protein